MKKIVSICIISILLLSTNALSLANTQLDYDKEIKTLNIPIQIDTYEISETCNGDSIFINDFGQTHTPGQPQIPTKIISIAIPPNAVIHDIRYSYLLSKELEGTFDIYPVAVPHFENNIVVKEKFNEQYNLNYKLIYSTDSFFPLKNVQFLKTSGYRNFNLVDIEIYPFSYNPVTKQLRLISDMIVSIDYQIKDSNYDKSTKISKSCEQTASSIIYNYEQAKNWYTSIGQVSAGLYEFVIITLDSLMETVESLVQWEIEKGRTVNVVTLSWIEDQYEGYDTPAKIRNFLIDKYPDDEWGIQDVLIVGHWDDIPMRLTYQSMGMMNEENMPETDFYYAELSLPDEESWDSDSDHKYGENSDSIDYYAEVNVGRIPWSDVDTVRHICEKSVAFEQNNDPSFKNNILLLANFIDANTDGATFMEYCVDSVIHPWMDDWMKTRLYERDSNYQKDYVLNNANVRSVWSQGTFSIVSWHSHGNPYGSGNFISVDDCQYLNDDYPAIVSGASCSNSDTNFPNIGQAMMKQGAVGFLGANKATPYRTEWDDPSDGSDQSFKYFFISSITSEEKTQGQAHQYAISEMYQRGLWFQLKYETFVHATLFGNPNLGIAPVSDNTPPNTPDKPVGPSSGKINVKYTFTSVSTDNEGEELYYCWSWGDGETEWVGPYSSGEECSVTHKWTSEGSYEIKVKVRDSEGAESDWSESIEVSMPKSRNKINIYEIFYILRNILIKF